MRLLICYSPSTLVLLLGLHGLAGLAIFMTSCPAGLQLALALGVGFSCCAAIREYGPGSAQRITACQLGGQRSLLESGSGVRYASSPRLLFSSEYLVILEFRLTQGRRFGLPGRVVKLLLLPDSLARADDCRLRRYLQFDH